MVGQDLLLRESPGILPAQQSGCGRSRGGPGGRRRGGGGGAEVRRGQGGDRRLGKSGVIDLPAGSLCGAGERGIAESGDHMAAAQQNCPQNGQDHKKDAEKQDRHMPPQRSPVLIHTLGPSFVVRSYSIACFREKCRRCRKVDKFITSCGFSLQFHGECVY